MRKLIRNILIHEAKQKGVKPSKYLANRWNELQISLVGEKQRYLNTMRNGQSVRKSA